MTRHQSFSPYCCCILLAAGKSSRMGKAKWSLKVSENKTFAGYIAEKYKECHIPAVLVINEEDQNQLTGLDLASNIKIAVNSLVEQGRMKSLQCGLENVAGYRPCFVHNIDNPFVSAQLLHNMLESLGDWDYVVPVYEKQGGHPVLISARLAEIVKSMKPPFPVLRDFLKQFRGLRMPWDSADILLNLNTSSAYQAFLATQKEC